jgi:hypothetical protein
MNRRILYPFYTCLVCLLLLAGNRAYAQQDATIKARIDASQILIGDAAHVFYEVQHNPAQSSIQWPSFPDSLGKLEIISKTSLDTVKQNGMVIYKQRLDITGFDSGAYYVPSFNFPVIPKNGSSYALSSDSLPLLVQTVAVDTTKAIKPIKGIIEVRNTWRDYIWVIAGALVAIILIAAVIIYFIRSKRTLKPFVEELPSETLQEKAMKLLAELEEKQLWQKGQVKEYYVQLTDIVRGYVEARFNTAALELTTDELLDKARTIPGILEITPQLGTILRTADLAKFAKAQPTPTEHTTAMQLAREVVAVTRPVIIENPSTTAAKA